ncbi:MAG: GNAT family N-acetyltransferase [Acidobacteriaceae bacterium]|nr:GNAT family N-acetyltransferase [Acidobacteriaceae bacterium]
MPEMTAETLSATNCEDAKRWRELVEASALSDVYYLPEYVSATAVIEQTEPIAVIGGSASHRIMAPLLVRCSTADGADYKWLDAFTPYGYGGLLNLSPSELASAATLRLFFDQLHDYCRSTGIVCCVIRLHPYAGQQEWMELIFDEDIILMHSRMTYSINCENWDEKLDLPKNMSHGRYGDVRLAERLLHVTWASGDDQDVECSLNIFYSLYCELMDQHSSERFYRFPREYFSGLTSMGKQMGVVITWKDNEPVGANVALSGRRYAYGHLSAVNQTGRRTGASTLLNIEEARWARQQGCKLLQLGGGMQQADGIAAYKKSFHGPSHAYHSLNYIIDRSRFESIRRLPNAPWPYNLPILR